MGLRTLKRRRRENKTDYKARKILLTSDLPRIVVRRTNKYFILQAVESHEAQDKVIATVTSKELLKNGWDDKMGGSLKSIPAGYLTGLLLAKKLGEGNRGFYPRNEGLNRVGITQNLSSSANSFGLDTSLIYYRVVLVSD